jgi:hypothetical protein
MLLGGTLVKIKSLPPSFILGSGLRPSKSESESHFGFLSLLHLPFFTSDRVLQACYLGLPHNTLCRTLFLFHSLVSIENVVTASGGIESSAILLLDKRAQVMNTIGTLTWLKHKDSESAL